MSFTIFFKTVLKFIRNFQRFPRKLYCSVYDCSFISREKRRKCPLYFKSNSQFRGVVNIFEKKIFVEILLPLVIVLLQILFENSMSVSDGQRILWTAVGKFCNLLMLLNLYLYNSRYIIYLNNKNHKVRTSVGRTGYILMKINFVFQYVGYLFKH